MPVSEVSTDAPHELKLSIQYDHKIPLDSRPGFNLHTGLLPDWGGTDILYHTLRQGARSQGLTFHQMTDQFDQGPIVSTVSYPVLRGDDMVSLYRRMALLAPGFLLSCMAILDDLGLDNVTGCPIHPPTLYRRGEIAPGDCEIYKQTPSRLRAVMERGATW
jgi:methionyl-tRNA formyltransferase